MPTTSKGVPYPAPGSSNDVPTDLQTLAEWIDLHPGVSVLTTAQRDALTGGDLYEGRLIVNLTTGRAERRVGSTWQPAVPLPTPAEIGAAPASHGVHGVSSVNGRTGAVTGLAEASHGAHGVSSVNGRTGDVTGLAESGHIHGAVVASGTYVGNNGSPTNVNLPFRPRMVLIGLSTGTGATALIVDDGGGQALYVAYDGSGPTRIGGCGVYSNGFTVNGVLAAGLTWTYTAFA
jgi:hypothetical protein